jgi:hypothetical protein
MNLSTRDPNHQKDGFWVPITLFKKNMSDRNSVALTEFRSLKIFLYWKSVQYTEFRLLLEF